MADFRRSSGRPPSGRSFGSRAGGFGGGGRSFGGPRRSFGGGGRSFGGRSSGGFGERRPLEMHEVTCSKCKKQCEVPFKPTGDKPVFCRECFGKNDNFSSSSGSPRRDFGGASGTGASSEQFNQINKKLDKIMEILSNLELDVEGEDEDEDEDEEDLDLEDEDEDSKDENLDVKRGHFEEGLEDDSDAKI